MVATYNLSMKSEVKEEVTQVELGCCAVPDTVRALKEEIEEQCSVPVKLQSLVCEGKALQPNTAKLKTLGVKTRDTVEVGMRFGREGGWEG